MAKPSEYPSLEEKLLHNAVDTVAKNVRDYDPAVLVYLVQQITQREDLGPSIFRVLSSSLTAAQMKQLGVGGGLGMAGTDDQSMNFLTMPTMHRTLLRGIQQMQEKLMPGGFLLINKDVDHATAGRMLRDATAQMEKVLRLTKAARANAEVLRLKEAFAEGLKQVMLTLGPGVGKQAHKILDTAIRESLAKSKSALDEVMEEAENL